MGTKQIRMEFQVVADDKVSANVTVAVDGVQKFSGPVAHTTDVMPGQVLDDQEPYSQISFDLDVSDQTPEIDLMPPNGRNGQWIELRNVTITVTGGDITLQSTEANYTVATGGAVSATITGPKPDPIVPGDAVTFYQLFFGNQPVWTPEPANPLDRFNFEYNLDTSPGSLLVLNNESVAYQCEVTLYSAA